MILYYPKDHPEYNLPSKKQFELLSRLGIDPSAFFGNNQDPNPDPLIHYVKLHHFDYRENRFTRQTKIPCTMTVSLIPNVILLLVNNECKLSGSIEFEALALIRIVLKYLHSNEWVLCRN
jgi:hypothetical protein